MTTGSAAIAALTTEFHERLDAPDVDDDILSRPVAEVIEDILHDLAIGAFPGTRPFKRRTPQDVAALQARAANLPLPPARPISPAAAWGPSVAARIPRRQSG